MRLQSRHLEQSLPALLLAGQPQDSEEGHFQCDGRMDSHTLPTRNVFGIGRYYKVTAPENLSSQAFKDDKR